MIAGGELNKKQLTELRKALASMELPPQKRQRLIWRLAKYGVIAAAKRHVRNQESPDGQKWPGRKTKRKGKMLRNLPKLLHIREMPEIQAVRIYLQGGGYRNGETPVPAGTVGYAQQNGMRVKVSRSSQPRKADAGKMATPAQAKKLRALGYRVRTGKRWKKPTLGDITRTMPYSQGEFTQLRDSLINDVASGLADLQGKSARAWVFTASGDTAATLLALVKDIPQPSAVYAAAIMLAGKNLDGIRGMIHDVDPDTGA
ncbi:hypothetical protein CAC99_19375 [Salmonella enterica]|nr:hypothetical protein [Salmonella enterica]